MAFTPGKFEGLGRNLAIDLTPADHATAQYPVGTRAFDSYGNELHYVKFNAAAALGDALKIVDAAFDTAVPLLVTPTTATKDVVYALALIAQTQNYFGWVLYSGVLPGDANIASATVAAGDPLQASGTAGRLDIVAAANIGSINCKCMVDDTDNTGTVRIR